MYADDIHLLTDLTLLTMFMSAPALNNASTTGVWLLEAAKCKGVELFYKLYITRYYTK